MGYPTFSSAQAQGTASDSRHGTQGSVRQVKEVTMLLTNRRDTNIMQARLFVCQRREKERERWTMLTALFIGSTCQMSRSEAEFPLSQTNLTLFHVPRYYFWILPAPTPRSVTSYRRQRWRGHLLKMPNTLYGDRRTHRLTKRRKPKRYPRPRLFPRLWLLRALVASFLYYILFIRWSFWPLLGTGTGIRVESLDCLVELTRGATVGSWDGAGSWDSGRTT
ncbi:hypothetical protein CH063_04257 [Colletotrichum higginsianum]|uniref:Uncharacterized protein n=1 Tax=Colletotrichum higginsianum (strain IMI 349063) TaxID=759273 RepID=H1W5G0_COLHI|nr:hypothetical protein CH63R_04668 [Colletotrichum higginsianum IMI 349063]OBR12372.1 hypothetical protein CH63R_04668 [Colletotrichum higginsianum IMI 349063]CCF47724.1 hypothetical protein CH063_04257 [Colletotrichum higginsianum]